MDLFQKSLSEANTDKERVEIYELYVESLKEYIFWRNHVLNGPRVPYKPLTQDELKKDKE